MRTLPKLTMLLLAAMVATSPVVRAQTVEPPSANEAVAAPSSVDPNPVGSYEAGAALDQTPAGPPATPRHTGVKALAEHLVTNFKYLPSEENLLWAGAGGGLALIAHPFDDNVNSTLAGSQTAKRIFKAGGTIGELGTLLSSASVVYAVGRIKDEPKVSHLGMDLIEALVMSEALAQSLKYATRRERPDGSGKTSFPSGHAADTFAFATALERHLNWRYAAIGYTCASYVAISRLPANRHWLSDAVFGSAVGIIAGRTVTSHESERPFPVAVMTLRRGAAIMYVKTSSRQ